MGQALVTDLYELNMAASYLRHGMAAPATFSLFVRKLPPDRGFLVAAGLESCLDYLQSFAFTDEDLEWLRGHGFDDDAVDAFRRLRFSGDVWAVPEGRIVYANEPLLEVTAPIAEAQLVETYLLNQVTYQTAVATKAARCRIAAADRFELVDFSLRRTHGVEAGMAAARVSAMVGFSATSNVAAACRYGLRPAGTMAHSYVEAFPSETDAFRTFAEDFPGRTTFLVDTYDTAGRSPHGDRGDPRARSSRQRRRAARQWRSDRRGPGGPPAPRRRRSASRADLRQRRPRRIRPATIRGIRAPIAAAGIGTEMGVSGDAPSLDSAYKLVAYDGRPVLKLSAGKMTMPGAKQVHRGSAERRRRRSSRSARNRRPPAASHCWYRSCLTVDNSTYPPRWPRRGNDSSVTSLPSHLRRSTFGQPAHRTSASRRGCGHWPTNSRRDVAAGPSRPRSRADRPPGLPRGRVDPGRVTTAQRRSARASGKRPCQARALALACWNSASLMTPLSRRSASRAISSAPLLALVAATFCT